MEPLNANTFGTVQKCPDYQGVLISGGLYNKPFSLSRVLHVPCPAKIVTRVEVKRRAEYDMKIPGAFRDCTSLRHTLND